jgi:hypothetical protein
MLLKMLNRYGGVQKMKPLRRVKQPVAYETARTRVLSVIDAEPNPPSWFASAIWPGVAFSSQGAAGAATRILKRMEREGLVKWICVGHHPDRRWGWVRA